VRTASSTAIEQELYEKFNSSRWKPVVKLQRQDGNGAWQNIDHVKSFFFGRDSMDDKVGTFNALPAIKKMSFALTNENGAYSPNSFGEFADILVEDLPIRISVGYKLREAKLYTRAIAESSYVLAFHTQVVNEKIYNSAPRNDDYLSLPGITDDWLFFDQGFYDAGVYQSEGYYLSSIQDFGLTGIHKLQKLKMTCDTDRITVYYRSSNHELKLENNDVSFTYLGQTANGANEFTLPDINDRYFQFVLVFSICTWYSGVDENYASAIEIDYVENAEFFDQGKFLIDNVDFGSANKSKTVTVSCRDTMKKALETKVSTPDYTDADVATILQDVAKRAGIEHNDGVTEFIPATGYTVTIPGYTDKKAIDIFKDAMEYLTGKSLKWRLFINDDNYLQLESIEISTDGLDFALNYLEHLKNFSKSLRTDQLLQRVTVLSEEGTVDAEVELADQDYTTTGQKTLSWSGAAVYKRHEFTVTSGSVTIDEYNNENIKFTISGTSPQINVKVYGDKFTTYTGYAGEATNDDNMAYKKGFTHKVINPFVQSDAEAKAIAENLISRFGTRKWQATVSQNLFPPLQLNDRIILIEENTKTYNLFLIEKISGKFTAKGAKLTQSITLKDLGATLDHLNWDRNNIVNGGTNEGDDDIDRDLLFWDMDLWNYDEDTVTNVDDYRPVRAS
jgi:hypothetical protein